DYEILDVGLDYFGNYIQSIMLQWRYDKERHYQNTNLASLTRQAADYAVVFDQLSHLTALRSEAEIVSSVMRLYNLFFAAKSIVYLPIIDGEVGEPICLPDIPLCELPQDVYTWMRSSLSQNDMLIDLSYMSEETGKFWLKDIAFPQYISYYQQLSDFLSSICALGISNAREYAYIQKQEQQLAALIKQKDKLFSVLAHDLRGPLGTFIGLTEIMHTTEVGSDDETRRELSGMMFTVAKNLFDLLQNLLEWSMFNTGRGDFSPTLVCFATVAENAIKTINTAINEKQQILVKDYSPDIEVLADLPMLSSILRNLLFNAVKFTPLNGTITLSARQIKPDQVEISVADTGIGIPEAMMQNLFIVGEKVSRAGTNGESSTGLGLILCNDFALAHGSRIRVTSRVGLGTRFSFILSC
ncbi:MAG: HAMP domain-containing sensor histidine kinase, partial [Candidatus Cloacimonadaceae bacterium]|nr:HAMP domain-containing sensor histidine kinase [Candidatus Cloacimonadaceae bacterium]